MVKKETGGGVACIDTHGSKFCPDNIGPGDCKYEEFTGFDLFAMEYCGKNKMIDQIAVSFARSKESIRDARRLGSQKEIIAKIEDKRGVSNQTEIIAASDAILIDRGDLSKSFPSEEIPRICREIILTCKGMKTPVWIATNLLESMVGSPHPTQAEVNDIATLLMLGVDGLVLAAETAIGKYPIECVQFVRKMVDLYELKRNG